MMAERDAQAAAGRLDPRKTQPIGGEPPSIPGVLAETIGALAATDDGGPWHAVLSEEDRRRLLEVVRSRRGRPSLDLALASDLVSAVLPGPLAALADGPDSRRRLVERIAQSLLDDPRSTERLQGLLAALVALSGIAGGAP